MKYIILIDPLWCVESWSAITFKSSNKRLPVQYYIPVVLTLFLKLFIPVTGFIQIFTVTATSVLADITLTATHRIIWLWRL